jgi:hypothetical protein
MVHWSFLFSLSSSYNVTIKAKTAANRSFIWKRNVENMESQLLRDSAVLDPFLLFVRLISLNICVLKEIYSISSAGEIARMGAG